MVLHVGRTVREETHEAGLLCPQLLPRANVAGHFAGLPCVPVSVRPHRLRQLLDEIFDDDVHPRGVVLRLLAERAHPVVVFKVAVQTMPAEGVPAAQGDRILKQIHADGAYQLLLHRGGLSGCCWDGGHVCWMRAAQLVVSGVKVFESAVLSRSRAFSSCLSDALDMIQRVDDYPPSYLCHQLQLSQSADEDGRSLFSRC